MPADSTRCEKLGDAGRGDEGGKAEVIRGMTDDEIALTEAIGEKGIISDGDWIESKDQDPSGNRYGHPTS